MDGIDVAMKALTFTGVAVSAVGIAWARLGPRARGRCYLLGALGVVLMYAMALVPAEPMALGVGAAYLGVAAATMRAGLREPSGEVVPEPKAAVRTRPRAGPERPENADEAPAPPSWATPDEGRPRALVLRGGRR